MVYMMRDSVLFDEHTGLNHYQVVECIYNGRPARVLYSGNNRLAAQSGMPLDGKPEMLFDYNERFMELIRGVRPRHVLVLGGGAFTLPIAARAEFPSLLMDVVELDASLPGVARKYFGFREDDLLHAHVGDGIAFLGETQRTYDLILVDVFFDASIPDTFQSVETMEHLKRRTGKKGMIAFNVIGALEGDRSLVLRRLTEGLRASFPRVNIFPAAHGLSSWSVQNFVIIAQPGDAPVGDYLRYQAVDLM